MNKCFKSTSDNPFMNINVTDNKKDIKSCKVDETVEKNYSLNLYTNYYDLFDNISTRRQFYTMPIDTIPNKQYNFSKSLFYNEKNCKSDNYNCLEYINLKYN